MLTVKLGFMLTLMRGPIEQAVHEELDKLFAEHRKATEKKPASSATAKKTPAGRKRSSP
jgi:hypothetical protein